MDRERGSVGQNSRAPTRVSLRDVYHHCAFGCAIAMVGSNARGSMDMGNGCDAAAIDRCALPLCARPSIGVAARAMFWCRPSWAGRDVLLQSTTNVRLRRTSAARRVVEVRPVRRLTECVRIHAPAGRTRDRCARRLVRPRIEVRLPSLALFFAGWLEPESAKCFQHVGIDRRSVLEAWIEKAHGRLLYRKLRQLPHSVNNASVGQRQDEASHLAPLQWFSAR